MDSWIFFSLRFPKLSWKMMFLFYRLDKSMEMDLKKWKPEFYCEYINWDTEKLEAIYESLILDRPLLWKMRQFEAGVMRKENAYKHSPSHVCFWNFFLGKKDNGWTEP